jgi:methyltransferase (TIGR00027 family)
MFDPIARTAWLTARLRAGEADRSEAPYRDPFAARLIAASAVPDDAPQSDTPLPVVTSVADWTALSQRDPRTASAVARAATLAVRSRYFDDALLSAVAAGARSVVLLGAGLDARLYRLPLPAGLQWIEVDRVDVLAHKRTTLADVPVQAELLDVAGDLRDPATLAALAPSVRGPSFWLLEGVLMYLQPGEVEALLDRVAEQLDPGSSVAFDVPNLTYLDPHGPVAAHAARHVARGSPWTFATDAPAALMITRGLDVDVVHVGHPRAHFQRLPWPPSPDPRPGQPTSFLVTGTRPLG